MGYQLWTSDVTGYRRVGTRIQEIRHLFVSGINVKAIYEPLKSCSLKSDARQMKEELIARDFDVAGVVDESTNNIVGYLKTQDLGDGIIRDYTNQFHSNHLISDSTPIAHLFQVLSKNNYLFVLAGSSIEGIVTLADLNKPPVRIYLFGIIPTLEMHMTYWINKTYGNEEWIGSLSKERITEAKELYQQKKEKNQEIDLINCIQFGDKKTLTIKNNDIRDKLNLGGRNKVNDKLRYAEKLRNNLAHSQADLASERSWEEIFNTVEWIEKFLINSDQKIEEIANKKANNHVGNLK